MVDPIVVSYSELDTFRQCPLKHHLAYVLRYKKPPKEDSPLTKGTLYHQVMEEHYRTIKEWQDNAPNNKIPANQYRDVLDNALERVMVFLSDPVSGAQSENQSLIQWMYEGYVQQYGIDEHWRIVGVEHNIVTPLRTPKGRRSNYHLKAKIDLVVRERGTGTLWVVDHKSGANLPNQMDLELDDQFGLYTWLMREMGRPIAGAIHSANRTTRNKGDFPDAEAKYKAQSLEQRMRRTYLNRSNHELNNLAVDAYNAARAAYPPKSQPRLIYSSPDPRQCSWKCDFKEPHILSRKGRDIREILHEYDFRIDKTRH